MLQIFLALAVPMAAVSELERLLREKEDVNNNDKNNNEKQEEQQLVPVVEKPPVDPAPIAKPTRKMRRLVILIMLNSSNLNISRLLVLVSACREWHWASSL